MQFDAQAFQPYVGGQLLDYFDNADPHDTAVRGEIGKIWQDDTIICVKWAWCASTLVEQQLTGPWTLDPDATVYNLSPRVVSAQMGPRGLLICRFHYMKRVIVLYPPGDPTNLRREDVMDSPRPH